MVWYIRIPDLDMMTATSSQVVLLADPFSIIEMSSTIMMNWYFWRIVEKDAYVETGGSHQDLPALLTVSIRANKRVGRTYVSCAGGLKRIYSFRLVVR